MDVPDRADAGGGLMRRPLADRVGYISQKYGENANSPEYGYGPGGHPGTDYGGVGTGTPVLACHAGTVTRGLSATFGIYVSLAGEGVRTQYSHLMQARVSAGQQVVEGQEIGLTGATGNCKGAHLDLMLWINGVCVDPEPFVEGGRMPSKLTAHFQTLVGPVAEIINASPVKYVKQIFYGSEQDSFPAKWTIARMWIGGDATEQQFINQGAAGAEQYFQMLKARYSWLKGKVWAIEGPNEPYVETKVARQNLAAFTYRWVALMATAGWRVVVGNFANGTPDVTNVEAIRDLLPMFMGSNVFLGLHQYGRPDLQHGMNDKGELMGPEWQPLRHRKLLKVLRDLKAERIPQVFINEFGLDGTGTPAGQVSWRKFCQGNFEQYLSQLAWADAEFQKDPEVLAVPLWNTGGTKPWTDPSTGYELGEAEWRRLAAYIAGEAVKPPAPVPAPPPAPKGLTAEQTDEVLTALAAIQTQIGIFRK